MYTKLKTAVVASCTIFTISLTLSAAGVDINDLSPVVIRTFPVAGDSTVDPSTTKIYVTFSQKMVDKSWSFVMQDKETFPKLDGTPAYDKEQRTCTLNVSLEPEKTYIIWINSARFANFKGVNGKTAVPYMLSFKTAGKAFKKEKTAAIAAAESWLKLLNDAKFADSWKTAAPYFQSKVKEEQWTRQIAYIYSNIGKVKSRKLISSNYTKSLPNAPKGEYFILRFATSFEKKSKAVETIVPMLTPDGTWKISGYFIK